MRRDLQHRFARTRRCPAGSRRRGLGSDPEGRAAATQTGAAEAAPAATAAPSTNGGVRDGIRVATVHPNGSIKARGTIFNVRYALRGQDVFVVYEAAGLMIFDDRGTLVAEHL